MNKALATYATDSRLFDMDSFTLKHLEHALGDQKPPEMLIVPIRIAIAPGWWVNSVAGDLEHATIMMMPLIALVTLSGV